MAFNPRNLKPDGFQVVNGGIHSGIAPNTLSRNQLAWAVNVTCRGGFPETRPGWTQRVLDFDSATTESRFEDNLFQGAIAVEGRHQLVASIGGRIFLTNLDTWGTTEISIATDLNQPAIRQAWMAVANGFAIIQNGKDKPLIWDGATLRRADSFGESGTREVPTGTVMAFVGGRLWVASPNGQSFVAGDITYGPTGTAQYGRADSVLKFTENTFLNEGGAFGIPLTAGHITAMAPIAQLDTSTGQGPLQVFTDRAIFSVNAPPDRTEWKNLEYPIQSVSSINSGATGWAAATVVNGDIWYRSQDGIRSFAVGRRDFGTWANTPQSFELERILPLDSPIQLKFASAAVFDNRLLVTTSPQQDWDHGTYHLGLGVLDLSGITALGATGSPAWEGVWTGLRVLQLVTGVFGGVSRLFAYTLSTSDEIQLWELEKERRFDYRAGTEVPIQCFLETGSFNWGSGFDLLKLEFGEVWYDELAGRVEFVASYRPDQDPCWQSWATWDSCANVTTCATADTSTGCGDEAPANLRNQYRRRVRLPTPADTVDSVSNKPYRHGDEFQGRLAWTGAARIKKLRLWSSPVPEAAFGAYDECQ